MPRPSSTEWRGTRNGSTALRVLFSVALGLGACGNQEAGSREVAVDPESTHEYRVTTVVEGLAHPWGLAFLPEGELLVTERPGRLRVIRNGQLDPTPVAGVPEVYAEGQGGLLDVALHPNFAQNRLLYLSFSKPGPQDADPRPATTAVVRGRFDRDRLVDVEEIFEADAWAARGGGGRVHFGSRLVFDREGHLYITVGDRGHSPGLGAEQRAQDRTDHAGTTIRLHDDGRVPRDNPFVNEEGARPEIYSYGHRNAQGMAVHPETGEVWQNEHGPRGGDKIIRIEAGRNYGWPVITYGINYDGTTLTELTEAPGMEQPLVDWTPSIAPSGMTFYTGDVFPNWRGNAFVGALRGQHLRRVVFDGTRPVYQEELLTDANHRIRDVRTGPDGFLYLLVDAADAPVLRLEPVR
jgi:aldose sugar dehydrogenase